MKRRKKRRQSRNRLPLFAKIYLILFPLVLYLTLEVLNTVSVTDAYFKVLTHFPYVALSYISIMCVICILFSIVNNLFFATSLVSLFLYAFYIINFYRKEITGWAFVPADFSFINKLGDLASFANFKYHTRIGASFVLILFLLGFVFVISKRFHYKIGYRIKTLVLSSAIFFGLFFTNFSKINVLPKLGLDTRMKFTVNQIYEKYGALMGFYVGYNQATNLKPDDYSSDMIRKISNYIEQNWTKPPSISKNMKPNVIVIMSEAFADPTRWSNINFSAEPIPNLKKLRSESIYGNIVSPAFGGATCNVEYEFNTCNSLYFLKSGVIPYEQFDTYFSNKNMISIPKIFKQNGYKTIGLHTYNGDFFNRNKIYPVLGFDEFISAEKMKNTRIKGDYISDEYFTDRLIELMNKEKQPIFVYGITMENHYPFQPNKFKEPNIIKSESKLLNKNQLESVDSYLHGINDADTQLNRVVSHLKKSSKPTILIFFGDHLPILADSGFGLYADLKYIPSTDNLKWSSDDCYNMFTTPYIIWNNFSKELGDVNLGDMSPYFLGNYLINLLGFEKPLRLKFMDLAYDNFHALKENLFVDMYNNRHNVVQNNSLSITNAFWNLQYDSIWGDKFLSTY